MYTNYRKSNRRRPFFNKKQRSFGDGLRRINKLPQPLPMSLLVQKAEIHDEAESNHEVRRTFLEFNLSSGLIENIRHKGYEKPTPIQDQAIEAILEGTDLVGIANTGTGKTGAFLIPLVQQVLTKPNLKVMVMAPTRELALQIGKELNSLVYGMRMDSVMCIGGTSMRRQYADLRRHYRFVIGTPGRLKDLLQQELIELSDFRAVVLDEVDRMLDMGFVHDMREILGQLPKERQSLFFSATVSEPVKRLIGEFSRNLMTVSVKQQNTARTVDQDIIQFSGTSQKITLLTELLASGETEKVLIFGRTKHGVNRLSRMLVERGFRADSIHGNKTQGQRQRALLKFRRNEVDVLVATDVAARGLDVPDVTHVVNFDMPATYDDYVHRIGRTGRANRMGKALTFVER